jgi:uncharacterized protein YjiS (DUF1127 family)
MDSIMDSRPARLDPALWTSFGPDSTAFKLAAIHQEARALRDAEIARRLTNGFRAIGRVLGVVGTAIATWPTKRATYQQLRQLNDRELADIGMVRGDIARVFEPGYELPAAANSNRAGADKAA